MRLWKAGRPLAVFALGALVLVPSPASPAPGPKNGTTLAASKTVDICEVAEGVWRYSGEIAVWNEGAINTVGLAIQDCIQNKTGPGHFEDAYCMDSFDPALHEVAAGTTQQTADVYSYSVDAAPLDPYIRNVARVTILNHSGSLGIPKGPEPKADWTGDVQPCEAECGCVLGLGYWKTHPENWPAGFDPGAVFFLSNQTWLGVLQTSPGGAYFILAHQYIAAALNQANGACAPSGVLDVFGLATAFFGSSTPASCPSNSSCGVQRTWAGILDSYNKGQYPDGPLSCE